jgi:2-polyprenyl-3-methyl-5-hydroxy-6-metoxy-1,4-benzoquinol methylase
VALVHLLTAMVDHFPARERWRRLRRDAPRDEYFRILREAVIEFYLSDPSNPYQQSGRSSGAHRWEETRRLFVKAIHRSGDLLDVGCANGLLLETLIAWAGEAGFMIRPHGIDLVPELVDLARQRFPGRHDCFEVANAFYWTPRRQYDFVRTNLEYVPEPDWIPFVRRQQIAVAPGGRLIVSHYRNVDEAEVDAGAVVERAGFTVLGRAAAPGVSIAWVAARD